MSIIDNLKKEIEPSLEALKEDINKVLEQTREKMKAEVKHDINNLDELKKMANNISRLSENLDERIDKANNLIGKIESIEIPTNKAYKKPLKAIYWLIFILVLFLFLLCYVGNYWYDKNLYGIRKADKIEYYRNRVTNLNEYYKIVKPIRERVQKDNENFYYVDFRDSKIKPKNQNYIQSFTEFKSLFTKGRKGGWFTDEVKPKYKGEIRVYLGKAE